MLKLVVGLFIGLILAGALFFGPLKPIVTEGQEGTVSSQTQLTNTANDTDMYSSGNVQQMLQEAKAQIRTAETGQYYDKLVTGYDIKDTTLTESQIIDESSVLSVMPDIQRINNTAASMPLIEAGKDIKDEDIAKFYYKLLEDSGWNIKP
ncbi:MAG: hypothetical protein PHY28_05610 [Dehalococcoidales bacterium]|nr:hypothetical protein [Dehalococcoidales bacterium]